MARYALKRKYALHGKTGTKGAYVTSGLANTPGGLTKNLGHALKFGTRGYAKDWAAMYLNNPSNYSIVKLE